MFSYYGSKQKIVKLYSPPKYDLIIEPFAGAAWYALLHAGDGKSVLLNEKYDKLHDIWYWLIHHATRDDLLAHRNFYVGEAISSLSIPQPHKDLIGFCINRGSTTPKNIVQRWSCQVASNPDWASTPHYTLGRIATRLPLIKTFSVQRGSYNALPNVRATWFIDPPYRAGGECYVENQIDYEALAVWCQEREGQVIVCENNQASWLPFTPLVTVHGQVRKNTESVWEQSQ